MKENGISKNTKLDGSKWEMDLAREFESTLVTNGMQWCTQWTNVNRYCSYKEELLGSRVVKWLNYIGRTCVVGYGRGRVKPSCSFKDLCTFLVT